MLREQKNPEIAARAYKGVLWKIDAIISHGVTPDLSKEAQNALIKKFSIKKAIKEGVDPERAEDPKNYEKYINGQAYYVELLVKFAGLPVEDRFQTEYDQAFPDIASYDEMMENLMQKMSMEPSFKKAKEDAEKEMTEESAIDAEETEDKPNE